MQNNLFGFKNIKNLKVLAISALFAAFSIILGKFLAFNIGVTLRFSLENLPIILSGFFFGGPVGALTALVADIIGCILRGYAINPILTFASVFIGFTSGLLAKLLNKLNFYFSTALNVTVCHFIGSVLIKTVGLSLWYGSPFLPLLIQRSLNYIIVAVFEYFCLVILLKNKSLKGQISSVLGK